MKRWWTVVWVACALGWWPAGAFAQAADEGDQDAQAEDEGADPADQDADEGETEASEDAEAQDAEAQDAEAQDTDAEGEDTEGDDGEPTEGADTSTTEAEAPSPEEAAEAEAEQDDEEGRARPLTKAEGEGHRPDAGIPLRVKLNGYYRARLGWYNSVPVQRSFLNVEQLTGKDARFGFQRLRLEPSVLYGSKEDQPVAALRVQLDGLDNVVFGDNARITRTPLFAADPSLTTVEGFELQDSIFLRRAWIEFLIPVGQIRIGRMPSMWGQGILTHDGNGLGEWGDPLFGTTYDRILFATRPLTIFNALAKGDSRETPLILAIAYDRLVQDPVTSDLDPPTDIDVGPVDKQYESRAGGPSPIHPFVTGNDEQVNEQIFALVWSDDDWRVNRESDYLTAGYYFVYRWQDSTDSKVYINDFMWDIQAGLSPGGLSLYTAGEFLNIYGHSRGISLTGGCTDTDDDGDNDLCDRGEANIFGFVGRAGIRDEDKWGAELESGFSSGDGQLQNDKLTVRPLNPDYHVGLLMYQVAIAAKGAAGLGEGLRPLWPRGGVWNSVYFWPQARYTLIPGIEVHAGFLVAWAHKLLPGVYNNNRGSDDRSCQFDSDCFIGWETDIALRVKWGENDLMNWDTEFGVMKAGEALSNPRDGQPRQGLEEDYLWTVQTRIGMVF